MSEWYLKSLERFEELLNLNPAVDSLEWHELNELTDQLEEYENKEFYET